MHDTRKGTAVGHAKSMACMKISLIALVLLVVSVSATFAAPYLMGGAIQGTPLNLVPASVTTFAGPAQGNRTPGDTDATGNAARFYNPYDITTDGTNLYVADAIDNKIRKIVIATGVVTTLAGPAQGDQSCGDTDATGNAARFCFIASITTDGTNLYVTDNQTKIRKIVIATGVVTTLAGPAQGCYPACVQGDTDATGNAARFTSPFGITTDGTNVYVAEAGNNKIRKIVIATGVVTTLAGPAQGCYPACVQGDTDAIGNAARFHTPYDITTDGTNLYVADAIDNKIRKIVIETGMVTTLAGPAQGDQSCGDTDATGNAARFCFPVGITTDGTNLYVTDNQSKIRKIVIATGVVTTLAGPAQGCYPDCVGDDTDATGNAARFFYPAGINTDGTNLYVADTANNKIRKIASAITSFTVSASATNGSANPGTQIINSGSTATVTGSANSGYYFTGVSGCGGTAQINTDQSYTTFSYTTGTITADCAVTATYAILSNTQQGSNITVNPGSSTQVTFSNVTASGTTSVAAESCAGPPSGFKFAGSCFDLTTTATYTGTITVVIPYNESAIQGSENSLRLFHWESGVWKDVTTSVDTSTNTITGQVTSLSPFGIGYLTASSISDIPGRAHSTGANENMIALIAILAILAGVFILRKNKWFRKA
jgi:hypothetical protein